MSPCWLGASTCTSALAQRCRWLSASSDSQPPLPSGTPTATPLPSASSSALPHVQPAGGASKPTVVIIGTGWAGACLVRTLDAAHCNIVVLSQRNHMLFTPLLPQTCTGTLEFRSICEPVTRIQPALASLPNAFYRTMVFDVDFDLRSIGCISVGVLGAGKNVPVKSFDYRYDYLVLAHGARPNTFNIPGVEEHAFFLREISEARGIRRRLVQNIMQARLPTTESEEQLRLLHIVVVGGGPTGVEFAADLADFLTQDIPKIAPALQAKFHVTLVEANEVLGTFDVTLRNYCAKRLNKIGIEVKKAVVAEVLEDSVVLTSGEVLRCGLVVWSTGVGASPLNRSLKCDKNPQGRLCIDDHLHVLRDGKPLDRVWAIGDCAADVKQPLPTLAAVASRQGKYMASTLNGLLASPPSPSAPFKYVHLGSMASLGGTVALAEFKAPATFDIKGFRAFLIWRSAYFTMLGSIRSRLYVAVNWIGSWLFGRDVTYIAEISEAKLWARLASDGATKETARRRLVAQAQKNRVVMPPPEASVTAVPPSFSNDASLQK